MKTALVLDNVCWGLFDEPDNAAPDYLNDPRYQVVDSQYADDIRIGWVLDGSVWSAPTPPAQQYKREGLTKTEWISLFTGPEVTLSNKTKARLEDMGADFSYLTGGHLMDELATALGRPDATYRDLLRDVFFHFDAAAYPPGISVNSPTVSAAMAVQVALGLITQESSNTKLLGKPI